MAIFNPCSPICRNNSETPGNSFTREMYSRSWQSAQPKMSRSSLVQLFSAGRHRAGDITTDEGSTVAGFVRFRKELVSRGVDKPVLDTITQQLKANSVTVKTGNLVDSTVIASASCQTVRSRVGRSSTSQRRS
jgi:hypothetical protein